MSARHWKIWVAGIVLIAGLAFSTVGTKDFLFRPYLHEALYLPSGEFLNYVSLGYRQIAADLVWFSAIQYYGDFRKGRHNLDYFKGVIDIVTKLDPHFVFAYVFGGMVVSEDMRDFEGGIEILQKGMANNPTSWRLPFELGFLAFVNDYDKNLAARYFDIASRMPEAPERTKRFAAFMYSHAGHSQSAIELWEKYKDQAEEPWLKELAQRYIDKIRAQKPLRGKEQSDVSN